VIANDSCRRSARKQHNKKYHIKNFISTLQKIA